jgi:Site-specific recombinase XerC
MPGQADKQGPLGADINRFMRFLTLERGRSANTVAAYRADLVRYEKWLADAGVTSLQEISASHVEGFARSLTGSARTVQRRLSAVRSFHAFLVDDDRLPANPSLGIAGPSSPGRLPKALGVSVVQSLLDRQRSA